MSWDSVVEEARWEHHLISSEPELWVILLVGHYEISCSGELELREHEQEEEHIDEQSRVVERTLGGGEESWENGFVGWEKQVEVNPVEIENFP